MFKEKKVTVTAAIVLAIVLPLWLYLLSAPGLKKNELGHDKGWDVGNFKKEEARIPFSQSATSQSPSPEPGELLPNKLRAILNQVRNSSDPRRKIWEEAILLAWNDFNAAANLVSREFPEDREQRKADLLGMIGDENLELAQNGMQYISSAMWKMATVKRLASTWARRDETAVMAFALQLDGDFRNNALSVLGKVMVEDGRFAEAEQVMNEMAYSSVRSKFLKEMALSRATKDPYEALLWVNTLELAEDKKEATDEVISTAVPKLSAEKLIELANTSENESVRTMCVSAAANKLANVNPREAVAWAEQMPGDLKNVALLRITRAWASTDFVGATAYALRMSAPEIRATAIYEIGKEAARKDPSTAARWVESLPDEFKIRSAVDLTTHWYNVDSMAVSNWINGLANGPVKDRSLASLAYCLKQNDSGTAAEVAMTIKDSDIRNRTLGDIRRK